MTGLNKITERIVGDAEKYANDLLDDAKLRADDIITEAECEGVKIVAESVKSGNAESEKIISRAKSSSVLTERNILLKAKTELIDEAFAKAEEKIAALPYERYKKFIEGCFCEAMADLNSESYKIIPSECDRKLIEEIIAGRDNVTICEGKKPETGFTLFGGDISICCSISAVLAQMRSSLNDKVCAILFED